ncbi:MFS transporter [Streptomyces spinoverrucosus]|uniref:Putative tartrate transporter n=1 Tax=Streptomyces spinoverrucosus TaxID=284043 RepID=A0A4Y3VGF3_9ACTN|nr:MFS transporter [Streptomyces spinoverrucosus]GEC05977.1 MFS transporter [Streptomyces spinoverrucosus]
MHPPAVQSAVRKIFRRVVPLFFVMFVANYMDRVNLGFAQDELRADVGLSAAAFGLGAGIFFIAYALFEVPSNMLMERYGAKVWLTRIMISWGVVATAMAFVNSVEMFYALRFLLGVAEAGFFPAVIYYFSRWLPDSHRGRATSIFLMGSGTATVIVGPISGALMEMHGVWGHAGWQWMFFIEGIFSVVLGFVVYRFLDSGIEKASWLTEEEKSGLVAVIDAEQDARAAERGTSAHVSRWKLLADPQMLLFLWIYFAINVALYAVTFWLPSIVADIGGLSDFQVGLLTSVPWLCAIAAVYVSGRISDRIGKRRPILMALLVLGGCGTLLAVFVSPWVGLGALCLAAMGFKPASPIFWTIPQSYLDARAAAPGIALINSIGNLGGFVAPTAFGLIEDTTGSTKGGLIGLTVVGFLAAASVLLVRGGGRNDRVRGRTTAAVTPTSSPGAVGSGAVGSGPGAARSGRGAVRGAVRGAARSGPGAVRGGARSGRESSPGGVRSGPVTA